MLTGKYAKQIRAKIKHVAALHAKAKVKAQTTTGKTKSFYLHKVDEYTVLLIELKHYLRTGRTAINVNKIDKTLPEPELNPKTIGPSQPQKKQPEKLRARIARYLKSFLTTKQSTP